MTQPPPSRQSIIQNRLAAVCLFLFCVALAVGIPLFMSEKGAAKPMDNAAPAVEPAVVGSLDETRAGEPPEIEYIAADTRAVADRKPANNVNDKGLYIGIRKATPAEIVQVLPETKGKPALVMFHSQYCFDCKKIKPVLEKLTPQHPAIVYKTFDILKDGKAHPGVFNTFKPVTVPVLVFIAPDGNIQNVLYNYQTEAQLSAALNKLDKPKPDKSEKDS